MSIFRSEIISIPDIRDRDNTLEIEYEDGEIVVYTEGAYFGQQAMVHLTPDGAERAANALLAAAQRIREENGGSI